MNRKQDIHRAIFTFADLLRARGMRIVQIGGGKAAAVPDNQLQPLIEGFVARYVAELPDPAEGEGKE